MPADLSTARCPSCGAPLPLVAAYAVKCGNCGTVSETPEADRRNAGGQLEGLEFRIPAEEATKRAAAYLGQGALTPSDVATAARATLRPQGLLVPVWVYKMTIGCAWSAEIGDQQITQERAEVKPTSGKPTQTTSSKVTVSWSGRQGTSSESFDGQAVAAASGEWAPIATTLARAHHEDAKPLTEALAEATVVEASAASTAARDSVFKQVSSTAVAHCTAHIPGAIKRNVAVTPSLTAVERKTVYVPVWVMTYSYQGKDRTVIVDGLSGGVAGSRPTSPKRVGVIAAVGGLAFLLFTCCGVLNKAAHSPGEGGTPTATGRTPAAPSGPPAPILVATPKPASTGFVARVSVYLRANGSPWDVGSGADSAPDTELTVTLGSSSKYGEQHRDTTLFEEARKGDLTVGTTIAVTVEDRDFFSDTIGEGTGEYAGEPLWIVAGQSVVELLDPIAATDHPFASFQSEADARFDAAFSAQSDQAVQAAKTAAAAKDWAGCQAALAWFDTHLPRPGAAPLASVAAAAKLSSTAQGKLAPAKPAGVKRNSAGGTKSAGGSGETHTQADQAADDAAWQQCSRGGDDAVCERECARVGGNVCEYAPKGRAYDQGECEKGRASKCFVSGMVYFWRSDFAQARKYLQKGCDLGDPDSCEQLTKVN